ATGAWRQLSRNLRSACSLSRLWLPYFSRSSRGSELSVRLDVRNGSKADASVEQPDGRKDEAASARNAHRVHRKRAGQRAMMCPRSTLSVSVDLLGKDEKKAVTKR